MVQRLVFRILVIAATTAAGTAIASAQDIPRFEAGGQVTPLQLREFGLVVDRRNEIGVGGRFTVNLTRAIAVDSELDFYPTDQFFDSRRKIQGLVGLKAGVRKNRIGVFGKVRPGFMHVSELPVCSLPELCRALSVPQYDWRFALDMGGVVEAYPSSRFLLRFDAGDTFVRFPLYTDGSGRKVYFSSHNVQVGAGAAVRF